MPRLNSYQLTPQSIVQSNRREYLRGNSSPGRPAPGHDSGRRRRRTAAAPTTAQSKWSRQRHLLHGHRQRAGHSSDCQPGSKSDNYSVRKDELLQTECSRGVCASALIDKPEWHYQTHVGGRVLPAFWLNCRRPFGRLESQPNLVTRYVAEDLE